jgi:hypothetical protein
VGKRRKKAGGKVAEKLTSGKAGGGKEGGMRGGRKGDWERKRRLDAGRAERRLAAGKKTNEPKSPDASSLPISQRGGAKKNLSPKALVLKALSQPGASKTRPGQKPAQEAKAQGRKGVTKEQG